MECRGKSDASRYHRDKHRVMYFSFPYVANDNARRKGFPISLKIDEGGGKIGKRPQRNKKNSAKYQDCKSCIFPDEWYIGVIIDNYIVLQYENLEKERKDIMNDKDIYYLRLQFRLKISENDSQPFQKFAEGILEESNPSFRKVDAWQGNGDGGNDGFYDDGSGIFYQMYAPINPEEKSKEAANKLKTDFDKLKREWGEFSKIQEYRFLFNDKNRGTTKEIEEALESLRQENHGICFTLFLSNDLEQVFLGLSCSSMKTLGFAIDSRDTHQLMINFLGTIWPNLDKENLPEAKKQIDFVKDNSGLFLKDPEIDVEITLLQASYFMLAQSTEKARDCIEDSLGIHRNDMQLLAKLAEVCLLLGDKRRAEELLQQMREIDASSVPLMIMQASLSINDENYNDATKTLVPLVSRETGEIRVKAKVRCLLGISYYNQHEFKKAEEVIGEAISLLPDKLFYHYLYRLTQYQTIVTDYKDEKQEQQNKFQDLFKQLGQDKQKYQLEDIELSANRWCFNALLVVVDYSLTNDIKDVFIKLIGSVCKLKFDRQIEQPLITLLSYLLLPPKELVSFVQYLLPYKTKLSPQFSQLLLLQLLIDKKQELAEELFYGQEDRKCFDLVTLLKENKFQKFADLMDDQLFISVLAKSDAIAPELRMLLINKVDDTHQKQKLLFFFHFDQEQYQQAYEILQDIEPLENKYDYSVAQNVCYRQKDWAKVVEYSLLLLQGERREDLVHGLRINLLTAYSMLGNDQETVSIGKAILREEYGSLILTDNQLIMIESTILQVYLKKSSVYPGELQKAVALLEQYPIHTPSFEFHALLVPQIYFKNKDIDKALESIVYGLGENPTKEQYAQISSLLLFNSLDKNGFPGYEESLPEIIPDCFIKFSQENEWIYFGDKNKLDAGFRIESGAPNYPLLLGKKLHEHVSIPQKYNSPYEYGEVQSICSRISYMIFRSRECFKYLSAKGNLEGIQVISCNLKEKDPQKALENLHSAMKDIYQPVENCLSQFKDKPIPVSFSASTMYGVISLLDTISESEKGYIDFSCGDPSSDETERCLAEDILNGKRPFVCDVISLFLFIESGLSLKEWFGDLHLIIARSSLNFLYELNKGMWGKVDSEKSLSYREGHISLVPNDKGSIRAFVDRTKKLIELFESKLSDSVIDVSEGCRPTTGQCSKVPPEIIDSVIVATQKGLPLLTGDLSPVIVYEHESKTKRIETFSFLTLIRGLYAKGSLTFLDVLQCFGYLCQRRFRFLPFSSDDLVKAVFGDKIDYFYPKNIQYFHFSYLLTKAYGFSEESVMAQLRSFFGIAFFKNLSIQHLKQLLSEIVMDLPEEYSRYGTSLSLLSYCLLVNQQRNRGKSGSVYARNVNMLFDLVVYSQTFRELDKSRKMELPMSRIQYFK